MTDNQHVDRGDIIAQIDERDYRVALEQADAQVSAADDNIHNIDAQISVQEAQVVEASAQMEFGAGGARVRAGAGQPVPAAG